MNRRGRRERGGRHTRDRDARFLLLCDLRPSVPRPSGSRDALCGESSSRGLTLLEMLVAIGIFVMLGGMLVGMVTSTVTMWKRAERSRLVAEKTSTVFSQVRSDLAACFPGGMFICDVDEGRQRLFFVRTFGTGPERAAVYYAGKGNEVYDFADNDGDGKTDNRLRPLGGLARVAYYLEGRRLMRAISSPIEARGFTDMVGQTGAQALCEPVLHVEWRLWSQNTRSWKRQKGKKGSPEWVWDSTRGIPSLRAFSLHAGKASFTDPSDDVIPIEVEMLIVLAPDETKAHFTGLGAEIGPGDVKIFVWDARGFPDPAGPFPCLLIDDEWMSYKEKGRDYFLIQDRGVRGTDPDSHARGARVLRGRTFICRFYVPAHKEALR